MSSFMLRLPNILHVLFLNLFLLRLPGKAAASSAPAASQSMTDSSKRVASSSPVNDKLAELKRLRASADEGGSSAPPADSSNAILEAIDLLSQKMDRMALKSDLEDLGPTSTSKPPPLSLRQSIRSK